MQKYLPITNHLYTITYLLMSESACRKLTPEQQAIFKEAGAEATKYSVEVGIKADSEIVDFLKAQGMQVDDADVGAFVEASRSIWTDRAAEHGEDATALIEMISEAGGQGSTSFMRSRGRRPSLRGGGPDDGFLPRARALSSWATMW